ncbi:aldehyde dehydrogenase (NADP(+)) [Tamlana flava]|uniref:aldehyde dehydrogenase (NADP(+)) n=1 Tax=Tamlana flava TaxID=3158572 RepID=UPI00351AB92B
MSSKNVFYGINAFTNEKLEGEFINASEEEINKVVEEATKAFDIYRKKDKSSIANFLDQIGEEILNLGDALLERCHLETALPFGRLQGERGRTVNQLKLFAAVVREGSWVDARIDTAIPDRTPVPKPDIRHMLLPLGPVAVFGASNFPLAFSVAGGDTASALAAGCPVVFKGHPAHPGTSEMVFKAIKEAAIKSGMPKGVFSLIHSNSNKQGELLVKHPQIKAVGFTGSFRGGKALFDYANSRLEPIPVFAEMGSTNPVFILPQVLKEKGEQIAVGLAGSITLGVGQFCTNPGLSFVENSEATNVFYKKLGESIAEVSSGNMLTSGISKAYNEGLNRISSLKDVVELAKGKENEIANRATPKVFKTTISGLIENESLAEENFGPSSVLVEASSKNEIIKAAKDLEGHLTATIFGTDEDFKNYQELFDILEKKVGRIIINGYPTGVEVCHSMVHGGPYPATTAPQSTSVGTNAIKRFVRPVCFQDYPDGLLPDALKAKNKLNIWRLVNGNLEK